MTFIVICIACLITLCFMNVGEVTTVTGSDWATSGPATAGSVGVDSLIGTWDHVGSGDIPAISEATGYLEHDGAAAAEIRLDGSAVPFVAGSPTEDEYHTVQFMVRAKLNGDALAADGTTWFANTVSDGGTKLRLQGYLRNNDILPGFTMSAFDFMTGGTKESLTNIGSSGSRAIIPFNKWFLIQWQIRRHATLGHYNLFVNGQRVSGVGDLDTDTGIAIADLRSDFFLKLHAIAGITWQLTGPMQSWKGILGGPVLASDPLLSTDKTSNLVHRSQITPWDHESAEISTDKFATSGVSPFKRYAIGTATGGTVDYQAPGKFSANADPSTGWTTLEFDMARLLTATGSVVITLRDTTNAIIEAVTLSIATTRHTISHWSGNMLDTDSGDDIDLINRRYALLLHFHVTGQFRWTVVDMTQAPGAARTVWSGVGPTWASDQIDDVSAQVTDAHMGGMSICRTCWLGGVDSLATADTNGMTPAYATSNHVTKKLSTEEDFLSFGTLTNFESPSVAAGIGMFNQSIQIGRSGLKRSQWTPNVLAHLADSRGIGVVTVDGGSVNDMTSISDEATMKTVVAGLKSNIDTMLSTLVRNGNRAWLTTMIQRPSPGGLSTWGNLGVLAFNKAIISAAHRHQRRNLIWLSDVAGAIEDHSTMFTVGDDIHFNDAGDELYAKKMFETLTVPSPTNRHTRSTRWRDRLTNRHR